MDRNESVNNRIYLSNVVRRWPNREVPYTLSCTFDESDRGHIAYSFDEIEKSSCVRFRPATTDDLDWVHIKSDERGCFASRGFYGPGFGLHRLNLQRSTCVTKSVIEHELLHVLGQGHEQTRPDRDEYMTINWTIMKVNSAHNNWRASYSEEEAAEYQSCYAIVDQPQETANFDDCVSENIVTDYGLPYDWNSIMHYDLYL